MSITFRELSKLLLKEDTLLDLVNQEGQFWGRAIKKIVIKAIFDRNGLQRGEFKIKIKVYIYFSENYNVA